jgi:DNA-binding response OmpR family regulator
MNRPATVLVIDDDALIVALIEHHLTMQGHRVDTAGDGAAGVAQIRRKRPDVIVLDMMMPLLDGRAVLQVLQADPNLSTIPVLMLTARRKENDVVDAFRLGATDYLIKPFSTDELIARISRLLQKPADAPS